MKTKRIYQRCGLHGSGKAYSEKGERAAEFTVVDISASGLKIKTDAVFVEDDRVSIELHFSGHIVEMIVKAKARIVRKEQVHNEMTYSLSFESLSDEEKVEIDEVISFSCIRNQVAIDE